MIQSSTNLFHDPTLPEGANFTDAKGWNASAIHDWTINEYITNNKANDQFYRRAYAASQKKAKTPGLWDN